MHGSALRAQARHASCGVSDVTLSRPICKAPLRCRSKMRSLTLDHAYWCICLSHSRAVAPESPAVASCARSSPVAVRAAKGGVWGAPRRTTTSVVTAAPELLSDNYPPTHLACSSTQTVLSAPPVLRSASLRVCISIRKARDSHHGSRPRVHEARRSPRTLHQPVYCKSW